MSISRYLIVHRDHKFDPKGISSGAEMATLFLCRFLAKRGHKVILAGQFGREVEEEKGIEFWDLGDTYDLKAILERAKAGGAYHLVSAGRAAPLLISQNDESCLSRSLISHDRSSNDTGLDAKVLSKIADNIFCVSQAQKDFFTKDGVPEEKLTVIHNGVDLELFKASDHSKRDPLKLIFVGALVVDKGLHLLVDAYAKLKQKHQDLSLDVYGSAELWRREGYLNPVEIEKALPGIKFHGKVSQDVISKAMQTAGLCVIPSIWFDPFPLVSIDAQATGCPVVAFDVGGLKEGIQNGVTGIVEKEVSVDSLTRVLDGVLSNRNIWQNLSDNALKLSRPRFTWEKLTETVTDKCERASRERQLSMPKVGLFSTWNQECGLATYGKYLFGELASETYVVLSEETQDKLTAEDEANVIRCWNRTKTDFSKIKNIIAKEKVKIIFFNFHTHYRIFNQSDFLGFIRDLKLAGVRTVAHLHNTFTLDTDLSAFIKAVDEVIVLSHENRLEAVANGVPGEKVTFIPHGVKIRESKNDKAALREKLGFARDEKIISCFGFIQAHKGVEELIRAVAYQRSKGVKAKGLVLGGLNKSDPNGPVYLTHLKNLTIEMNVKDYIHFAERFLSNEEIGDYLEASDVVLMNYRSQHYEASGAASIAVGAGAVVAASIAPPFVPFKDAVWHITAGFDSALSIDLLLNDKNLRSEVAKKAKEYSEKYSWKNVAGLLRERFKSMPLTEVKPAFKLETPIPVKQSALKVLMQNRNNMFTQRGGDTILMEKTIAGLEKRGVKVTVDLELKEDPKNYDLVHIFNFVLADLVKYCGERAHAAGVPFVVTTLHEEISKFHNPSVVLAKNLIDYVRSGQSRSWYQANQIDLSTVTQCGNFENSWASANASALIANGEEEALGLKNSYPSAKIQIVPVGYDIGAEGNAEDFFREYGVKDFIFCVGRLESRKNQLMLLKALEDVDVPLVFAGGGFTYQPDYADAVKKFKRKGKTLVLDKMSPHMLASAYRAARVHVLPSWYELPGLVSLEAAYYGCNVVVTDYGTARSYFGDHAFYCEPGSENSILSTVLAAYNSPQRAGLKEVSMKYTWENASEKTLQTYESVINKAPVIEAPKTAAESVQVFDLDTDAARFQEMLERGEMAAKDKDLQKADKYLSEAECINPSSVRLLRAKGAVTLALGDVAKAKDYFERGLKLEQTNSRLYSGLGMCEMQLKNPAVAYDLFVKALSIAPTELVAILQLLECSYVLNKYDDLERALRGYLNTAPQDQQMQYCLAGCLFKQNRFEEASVLTDSILAKDSGNLGAKQLQSAIAEARAKKVETKIEEPKEVAAASLEIPLTEIVFDSTDRLINEIEEDKRQKNYKEVEAKCKDKLLSATIRADQREKLELLQSEAEILQGNIVPAEARYDKVLATNPRSARALCGKGALAASRGEWTIAKDYFDKAHMLEPNYDVAWAGQGIYALSINDRERAWKCFETAITINPENVRALLGIIELGYSLRRLDEVERLIKLYLDMHPLDLNFLYSLAGCYFAQDRLAEAQSEVDKVLMFDANHANTLELKGLIEQKLNASHARQNA